MQLRAAPSPLHFDPSLVRLERQRVITPDEYIRMRQGAAAQPIIVSKWQKACREGAISRQECASAIAVRSRPFSGVSGGPLLGQSVVSSDFGMRIHPVHGRWLMHNGRDYAAATGTPVVAAMAGTVVRSGWIGGYGLTVELHHSRPRRRTLYAHLSELAVKPGQRVRQGQQIGNGGSTGTITVNDAIVLTITTSAPTPAPGGDDATTTTNSTEVISSARATTPSLLAAALVLPVLALI